MPRPLIDFMGGLQHTEEDALVSDLTLTVQIWSVLLAPVLVIAAAIGAKWFTPRWAVATLVPMPRVPYLPLAAAGLAILAWLPPMLITQPEQQKRRHVEALLRSEELQQAFAFMSEHRRSDFPPVWDPPPRLGYGERTPTAADIAAALVQDEHAKWVYDLYLPKIQRSMLRSGPVLGFRDMAGAARSIELEPEKARRAKTLEWVRQHRAVLTLLRDRSTEIPQREREAIAWLLSMIENGEVPSPQDQH
jgi:hypothetical protein